jgi:chromosome partitioning protein
MAVIVVAAEKGGCGKTTVATNIAILRAAQGRDVLVVDADPQKSASEFFYVREAEKIVPVVSCVSITGRSVASEIRKLLPRYQDIIIDAGGRDNAGMRSALVVADVLVVPFLPGQYDVWSIESMDGMLEEALAVNPEMRCLCVLNKADTNPAIRDAAEAMEVLSGLKNLKLMDVRLGYRVAYRRSSAEGRAVTELDRRDSKAIEEITSLFKGVFDEA